MTLTQKGMQIVPVLHGLHTLNVADKMIIESGGELTVKCIQMAQ